MFVDDGFSVLDTGFEAMQNTNPVHEVKVVQIDITAIFPNPYQPRKVFEEEGLEELAASIGEYGVLQPLLVAPAENNTYLLIAGERRWRASKLAGLKEVPVIISEYTSQQIAEIALIENLQREDLNYIEEAEGYERLMQMFKLTQEAMAARVGKKQSTIANKLRLLRLGEQVREKLRAADLSERHARALLRLKTEEKQLQALQVIIKNNYNVRQTEQYIAKLLEATVPEKKKRQIIVNDVRIYLNSIKQVVNSIKTVGIPVEMEHSVEGEDVIINVRIKNTKKPKIVK